ncbi:MAG: diphthine synthase [Halobacteriales archaeon]
MLTFVGLGLYDERSITVEGREALRSADRAYAEFYTSRLAGASVGDLEAYHDVTLEVRDRAGVEQSPTDILDAAATESVVFLTAGDPMISTTHVDLRLRAEDRGINTRIVHGTTAQSAASGLTGLQNYRFGKATTLPFPDSHGGDGVPESVLDTIDTNRDRGLHTLVYLDIKAEREAYMSADHAADLLAAAYRDILGVAVARAGSPSPVVRAARLSTLAGLEFGEPLHLLVIPGSLHPIEADALEVFGDAPPSLLDIE